MVIVRNAAEKEGITGFEAAMEEKRLLVNAESPVTRYLQVEAG